MIRFLSSNCLAKPKQFHSNRRSNSFWVLLSDLPSGIILQNFSRPSFDLFFLNDCGSQIAISLKCLKQLSSKPNLKFWFLGPVLLSTLWCLRQRRPTNWKLASVPITYRRVVAPQVTWPSWKSIYPVASPSTKTLYLPYVDLRESNELIPLRVIQRWVYL